MDPAERPYIAIAGLIGVGKTTLAKQLGALLDLPVYLEAVTENAYLSDFYGDMARYGFSMQIYLLSQRFEEQQRIAWSGRGAVQDRTMYEDAIFARMLADNGSVDARDYRTYMTLLRNITNFTRPPSVVVYLHITPEAALARIRQRNRACEANVTIEYLRELHRLYEDFMLRLSVPVVRVEWTNYNDEPAMLEVLHGLQTSGVLSGMPRPLSRRDKLGRQSVRAEPAVDDENGLFVYEPHPVAVPRLSTHRITKELPTVPSPRSAARTRADPAPAPAQALFALLESVDARTGASEAPAHVGSRKGRMRI
jgi:deoxyadenosine kinase